MGAIILSHFSERMHACVKQSSQETWQSMFLKWRNRYICVRIEYLRSASIMKAEVFFFLFWSPFYPQNLELVHSISSISSSQIKPEEVVRQLGAFASLPEGISSAHIRRATATCNSSFTASGIISALHGHLHFCTYPFSNTCINISKYF